MNHTDRSAAHDELQALSAAACEGRLTATQHRRLDELLSADAEHQWFYLRAMQVHSLLEQRSLGVDAGAPVSPVPRSVARARRWPWLALVAVAASLLVAIGSLAWRPQPIVTSLPVEATPVSVWLARTLDCRWPDGAAAPHEGAAVPLGDRWQLDSGLAELAFASGARISVSGPAVWCVEAPDRLRLDRGRVTAVVPQEAIGFTVRAPEVSILDLGTEFGVYVQEGGATEVHVFEGKVELAAPDAAAPLPLKTLEQHQAARIDVLAGGFERLPAEPAAFHSSASAADPPSDVRIQDPFAGAPLDPAVWRVALPHRSSSLRPAEGGLEFRGKGHLATVAQFDPLLTDGVRIAGVLKFATFQNDQQGNFEIFQIYTRSDGNIGPPHRPDALSGLRFRIETRPRSRPVIQASGSAFRISNPVSVGRLQITEGSEYRFEIIDDGQNLSFTMVNLADPTENATTTATVSVDASDTNHIVLHNREGRHVTLLRDLVIATGEQPPAPAELDGQK